MAVSQFEGAHYIEDSNIQKEVTNLLGAEILMEWEEASEGEN